MTSHFMQDQRHMFFHIFVFGVRNDDNGLLANGINLQIRCLSERLQIPEAKRDTVFGVNERDTMTINGESKHAISLFAVFPKVIVNFRKNAEISETLAIEMTKWLGASTIRNDGCIILNDIYRANYKWPTKFTIERAVTPAAYRYRVERTDEYFVHDDKFLNENAASDPETFASHFFLETLNNARVPKQHPCTYLLDQNEITSDTMEPEIIRMKRDDRSCMYNHSRSHSKKGLCRIAGNVKKKEVYGDCAKYGRFELSYRREGYGSEQVLNCLKVTHKEHIAHVIHHSAKDLSLEQLSLVLFQRLEENGYRREPGTGNILAQLIGLPYWYDQVATPKEFINFVMLDKLKMVTSPDYLTKLIRILKTVDNAKSPFVRHNRNLIGFTNGVLHANSMTFQQDPIDQLERAHICFEAEYQQDNEPATPIFHAFLDFHFGGDETKKEFFKMGLGRLFFLQKQLDDWDFVFNLQGPVSSGKHHILNLLVDIFGVARTGFIVNGRAPPALQEKDIIIVSEEKTISANHPIVPIASSDRGDILRNDSNHNVFQTPYIIISPRAIEQYHVSKQVINVNMRESFHTSASMLKEATGITLQCLQSYHARTKNVALVDPFVETPMDVADALETFIATKLRYNADKPLGVPLSEVRSAFKTFLQSSNNSTKMTIPHDAFSKNVDPACVVMQPMRCRACNAVRIPQSERVKCCVEYSRTNRSSIAHIIKYIDWL